MPENPRFIRHVGMRIQMQPAGRCTCTLPVQDFHLNGNGVVHGGVLFTLADTAMGAALHHTLEEGQICATIETKIAYFKPVFEGEVRCVGEIVNKGKSVASTEASLYLGDVLVAKATGSFAIFMRKTAAPQG